MTVKELRDVLYSADDQAEVCIDILPKIRGLNVTGVTRLINMVTGDEKVVIASAMCLVEKC